jgi:hypothetical protein
MSNQQSILPKFDAFVSPDGGGAGAMGAFATPVRQQQAAQSGLGKSRIFALSPVFAAMNGLGEAAADPSGTRPMTAGDVATAAMVIGIVGALSYQAGKAIAPSRQDATTWGWIGVPVGLFTGVLGLGVMGVVSNQKKG